MSLATSGSSSNPTVVSRQNFDPWGAIRSGGISQTSLNYTGQRRDSTGLLSYHARYYDPVLARFISADSVVPGAPDGSMDGVALKPLTVDFHESGFVTGLNGEHGQGFWFQNTDQVAPWGPANPQGLNRYSYVQNNPLRYTDPTGHTWYTAAEVYTMQRLFHEARAELSTLYTEETVVTGAVVALITGRLAALAGTARAMGLTFAANLMRGFTDILRTDLFAAGEMINVLDWLGKMFNDFLDYERYVAPGAMIEIIMESVHDDRCTDCFYWYYLHTRWGRTHKEMEVSRTMYSNLVGVLGDCGDLGNRRCVNSAYWEKRKPGGYY